MSLKKTKYDDIFLNQQKYKTKSIFDYIVDSSMYINKNECNNYSAPFLTYIPVGTPQLNVDIENDLRGADRPITRCKETTYVPENIELATNIDLGKRQVYNQYPNNKKECLPQYSVNCYTNMKK